jgi:hypothetical protein
MAATISDCAAQVAIPNAPPPPDKGIPAPLTGKERFQFYVNETVLSPDIYVFALGAGLALQATGYPREWGGGFKGYGRRSASEYGLFATQNTIHDGAAAVLGYDPRYVPCRCTGAWRRTTYAMEMSFLTYDRNGHKRLDLPQLAGAYGSGMISALWYPKRYSPLVQGVQTGHLQVGFVLGIHLYQEFIPEIQRRVPLSRIFNKSLAKTP